MHSSSLCVCACVRGWQLRLHTFVCDQLARQVSFQRGVCLENVHPGDRRFAVRAVELVGVSSVQVVVVNSNTTHTAALARLCCGQFASVTLSVKHSKCTCSAPAVEGENPALQGWRCVLHSLFAHVCCSVQLSLVCMHVEWGSVQQYVVQRVLQAAVCSIVSCSRLLVLQLAACASLSTLTAREATVC